MDTSLEELSIRLLAGLLSNPKLVQEVGIDKDFQVCLARASVEMAVTLHEELVVVQNLRDMRAMENISLQQCTGGKP